MKLLIVEGCDRTGKDTLIQNLCKSSENYAVRHFGFPKGNNDFEKRKFQYDFFQKEYLFMQEFKKYQITDNDLLIWNRSPLGELIFGDLYRDTKPNEWVMRMETDFSFDIDPSVYLLLLWAPAEFLCKRDDGLSFSAEIDKKKEEIARFKSAFKQSKIMNKLSYDVSDGEEYVSKDEIFSDINKFLFE